MQVYDNGNCYGGAERGMSRITTRALPEAIRFPKRDLENVRACLRRLEGDVGFSSNSQQITLRSLFFSFTMARAPNWSFAPTRAFEREAKVIIRVRTAVLMDNLFLALGAGFEEIKLTIDSTDRGRRLRINADEPTKRFQGIVSVLDWLCEGGDQHADSRASTLTFSAQDVLDLVWGRGATVELGFVDDVLIIQHDESEGGGRSVLSGRSAA